MRWSAAVQQTNTLQFSLSCSGLHHLGIGLGQESDAALPLCPAPCPSAASVLATGLHSQQSSFIGSYIINEESKAPDDCDYLGRIDWSLQTGAAKRQIHNKYERGSAGKWGVMNLSGVHLHIYYLILHLQYSPVCALVSQYFRWYCLDLPQPLFYLFLMV